MLLCFIVAFNLFRMVVLEKGAPYSMCLTESAKVSRDYIYLCVYNYYDFFMYMYMYIQIVNGCQIVIVNPETKTPCAHTEIGEVSFVQYTTCMLSYPLFDEIPCTRISIWSLAKFLSNFKNS